MSTDNISNPSSIGQAPGVSLSYRYNSTNEEWEPHEVSGGAELSKVASTDQSATNAKYIKVQSDGSLNLFNLSPGGLQVTSQLGAGYNTWEVVVPSNDTEAGNLSVTAAAIFVGVGGNIAAVDTEDAVVDFTAVPAGLFPIGNVKRINLTDTSASNMVALSYVPGS